MALVVRLLYVIQLSASPYFTRPLLDQRYYDLCARQLAGEPGSLIDGFRPLLYPLYLSAFYVMDIESGVLLSILSQFMLGIGMCVLIALLTSKLMNREKVSVLLFRYFKLPSPFRKRID